MKSFFQWQKMTKIGYQLLVGFLFVVSIGYEVNAIKLAEIPFANLTLEGGPDGGSIDPGTPFSLDCSFTARYDNKFWYPRVTFYLNELILGNFFIVKKADNTGLDVHWDNQEVIPLVNVFSNSDLSHATHSKYSIWVQPLSDIASKGVYKCSITLEDAKKFSKARYYSNSLYFE